MRSLEQGSNRYELKTSRLEAKMTRGRKTTIMTTSLMLILSALSTIFVSNIIHESVVVKNRDLRISMVKEVFRDLTGKWDRNFVIFPISSFEDIQLMM